MSEQVCGKCLMMANTNDMVIRRDVWVHAMPEYCVSSLKRQVSSLKRQIFAARELLMEMLELDELTCEGRYVESVEQWVERAKEVCDGK